MKKIILSAIAIGFCFISFAQEAEKVDKKPERIKVVKGGESTPYQAEKSVKKEQTPEKELKNAEYLLEALIKKEAFIRNNPEELKLANENGWFADAEITKAKLEKRIGELKLELKNK